MKKKIIYIEQYFYPEGGGQAQISRDIVLRLNNNEEEIIVLCGDKPYQKASLNDKFNPSKHGIKIIHIPVLFNSRKFLIRFINYINFSLIAFLKLLFIKNIGLIISQTNPPTIIVVSALVSFLRKIPFLIISMDLYPEVLIKNVEGKNTKIIYKLLFKIFNIAYCHADNIISLGNNMTSQLLKKGVSLENIVTIPNWATGNLSLEKNASNKFIEKWGVNQGIKILYSGNLGIAHEFKTIFNAIMSSKLLPEDLQLVIVGFGSRLNEVIELSKALPYKASTLIKSYVDADDMPHTMGLASLGLVTLRKNYSGLVYPSKFAGYIARGIPILYIGPNSEISEIINKYEIGFCFKNGESERLSNFLINLNKNQNLLNNYGKNARNFYLENMSSKIGLEKYQNLVSKYI